MTQLSPDTFKVLSELVYKRSGLSLTPEKGYLLQTRLMPIARRLGLADIDALAGKVRNGGGEPILGDIVEAMTTNETFFFRDQTPFNQLRDVVFPELAKSRATKRALKIWCAACSTGQEPYSIAMLIKEAGRMFEGWRVDILATDLSNEALDKAKVGLYSQFEIQRGLPVTMLVKYFKQVRETWQIDSGIRAMVNFRTFNLLGSMAALGRFDVVFCRNVLIYFDTGTKATVLGSIKGAMAEDGFLFLGGSETVFGVTDTFKPLAGSRGVYIPNT